MLMHLFGGTCKNPPIGYGRVDYEVRVKLHRRASADLIKSSTHQWFQRLAAAKVRCNARVWVPIFEWMLMVN
jgi:hypothetical protein